MRTMWLLVVVMFVLMLSACGGGEQATPIDTPTETESVEPTVTDRPVAQTQPDDVCPDYVQSALSATNEACTLTKRNQACYGNSAITLTPFDDTLDIQFQQPGDIIDVAQIQTLRLEPLNTETNSWGIALMQLQANLSDTTPGQNVTFLMFGNVQLENRSGDATTNIESFYFTSGIGDAACSTAPESGMLIQTPEGVGKVDLLINEVGISIGSTAFVQAEPDADMIVNVVEGQAEVTSQGVTETVNAGNRTTIGLDANGVAASPPTPPEPYNVQPLRPLPVRNLPRPITITETVQAVDFTPIGFEISDSIADQSEVDVYTFDAVAGQRIYLDAQTDTRNLRWALHYNRPDNPDLAQDRESQISLLYPTDTDLGLFILEQTGTYQIVVTPTNDLGGTYQFKVWDVPQPDQLDLAPLPDMPPEHLGVGRGEIETPGAWDEYHITVEAGQTLYFDGLESPYPIKWNVYGADDEAFVNVNYDVASDLEALYFETAGTYTVRIWGDKDSTGGYSFQIWDVPPVEELDLTLPDDDSNRLIGFGSGAIETPGVEDHFSLDVEAGQTLYFDGLESPYPIKWNIYDSEYEPLINVNYDVASDLEAITFDSAATYMIQVWGDRDGVGAYSFQIWEVPPVDELDLTLPDDAPEQLIGMGQGAIESPGTQDIYTFDVEAGQTLYFDALGSPYAVKWNIYDPDDTALVNVSYDVGSDIETLFFESAGTYTIKVWGHQDGMGEYSFQIWDVPPPDTLELTLPDDVPAELMGVGRGEIETPGTQDIYTFDVEAGQTLYFDGVESPYALKWNIYNSNDEPLVNLDYDVASDLQALYFETAATYTIKVWGDRDGVGAYNFQIWNVPPPDRLELTPVDGIIGMGIGEIETPGAEDIYTLDVEAGQTLYFDGIESPYAIKWNIYNSNDEPLVNLDYDVGRDLETITFETAGTYTIRIWGHQDGVGSYQFEIRENE